MKLQKQSFFLSLAALLGIFSLAMVSQSAPGGNIVFPTSNAVTSGLSQLNASLSAFEEGDLGDPVGLADQRQSGLEYNIFLPIVEHSGSTTFYVSKEGNNTDGKSWSTAWNELDQIDWGMIEPGDTILLDGGSTEMVYATTLRIGSSGTPDAPITIQLADEPGRDGRVVIFGGRSMPLPYCGQRNYTFETSGVRQTGILIDNAAWVVIDGLKWSGITIHGHNRHGIRINSDAQSITVRNVEAYDNGRAELANGEWTPDLPGVNLSGTNITFERAIIHDNGQDAFQSGGGIKNFTLRESWIYNGRRHPSVNESFNYCVHTDGIQIFNGGSLSGFLVETAIIGPGFTNGINMGQELASNGIQAVTNDVTLRDVLFTKAADNNIMGHPNTKPKGWVIDHVTAHCPNTKFDCLHLEGSNHQVTNSIISGATISLPDSLDSFSGNCQWNTDGFRLGRVANPLFAEVDESDPFSLDDYSLLANSPCSDKGSRVTSVAQLLGAPDPDRLLSGLSWEAGEGSIAPPFSVSNGYVAQAVETSDPALGGKASYKFNISAPGNYLVKVLLDAPDPGSDSVFINIDGEPTKPDMIWDIETTDGPEERTAAWRGSGTFDNNEFVPKVFFLSAGEHQLIIRGRESNVRLGRVSVVPLPGS